MIAPATHRLTLILLALVDAMLVATFASLWIAGDGGAGVRDYMPGPRCPPIC